MGASTSPVASLAAFAARGSDHDKAPLEAESSPFVEHQRHLAGASSGRKSVVATASAAPASVMGTSTDGSHRRGRVCAWAGATGDDISIPIASATRGLAVTAPGAPVGPTSS
jgi:hypothetical protein